MTTHRLCGAGFTGAGHKAHGQNFNIEDWSYEWAQKAPQASMRGMGNGYHFKYLGLSVFYPCSSVCIRGSNESSEQLR